MYDKLTQNDIKKLEEIGTDKIIKIVRGLEEKAKAENKTLVLLCFEDIRKPGNWCHRTLFAEWWKKHTGETIEELEDAEPMKTAKTITAQKTNEEQAVQMSMF